MIDVRSIDHVHAASLSAQLKQAPLTHAALYNKIKPPVSASAAMRWSQKSLLPAITLREDGGEEETSGKPKRDLLDSLPK